MLLLTQGLYSKVLYNVSVVCHFSVYYVIPIFPITPRSIIVENMNSNINLSHFWK